MSNIFDCGQVSDEVEKIYVAGLFSRASHQVAVRDVQIHSMSQYNSGFDVNSESKVALKKADETEPFFYAHATPARNRSMTPLFDFNLTDGEVNVRKPQAVARDDAHAYLMYERKPHENSVTRPVYKISSGLYDKLFTIAYKQDM